MYSKRPLAKFFIDNNLINARKILLDMNFLENVKQQGWIDIQMPRTAHDEAMNHDERNNNYDAYYKKYEIFRKEGKTTRPMKAENYIYAIIKEDDLTQDDKDLRDEIYNILKKNSKGKDHNVKIDADIVFCAHYYQRILLTNDGNSKKQPGILGSQIELKEIGVNSRIMTTREAVQYVKKLLDENNIILESLS